MKLLAIETSGPVAGAAMCVDGCIRAEEFTNTRLTHSETILPMAERVLAAAGYRCTELDAVAVDIGPGSFTGIRIGVSAANAIAFAAKAQVIGVDSLHCLYANAIGWTESILTAIDSGNGRVYAAQFNKTKRQELTSAIYFGEFEDWLASVARDREFLFLGDSKGMWKERIMAHSCKIAIAGPALCVHHASSLAVIAYDKLLRGETTKEAQPFYIAKPKAERDLQHE